MSRYHEVYQSWRDDPIGFWEKAAAEIDWAEPWTSVFNPDGGIYGLWFEGAQCNTCYNCLDRHVENGRGDQAALIYDSPITDTKRTLTYSQLLDEVATLAGALQARGIEKGDRVILYLPMIPQAAVAMLACARIGAVHSVVFGGFAAAELATRIDDAKPKAILTASCGIEPNRIVEYKPLLDEAIELAAHKPDFCVVFQRPQSVADLTPGRDFDWGEFVSGAEAAACVMVAATDPLYILYTSGTTGVPKGVVRDNGGHMVALKWTMKNIYGMDPGDIYWAASDVGWVVGHSYIVYAPLLQGCTSILFEGKPARTKFIGRRRSYNGVGFGGISVGGIPYCRKAFNSALLPQVDHMPETYSLEHQAFSKGEPDWGVHLADELENIIYMNDAENIAGVIVEPVAGSTGVLVPPKGYLKRLREICDKHNLILIFDEVITAWGRLGKASAAEYFDVLPDIITSAKGINNGAVPMGATFVRKGIYDAFMTGPEDGIEFMHGYTYSGHPLACAAAIATLDAAKEEGLYERATQMAPIWEDVLHSLKDAPHVIDIRNIGLMGAVELDPGMRDGDERSRAMEAFDRMFFEEDLVMRFTGNVIASSPSLIVTEDEISQMVDRFRKVLNNIK